MILHASSKKIFVKDHYEKRKREALETENKIISDDKDKKGNKLCKSNCLSKKKHEEGKVNNSIPLHTYTN